MISRNFKKRLFTSVLLLFLLIIIFNVKILFLYSIIVLLVISIIEFLDMTKRFLKKKISFCLINFFFLIYLFLFCSIVIFFYFHIYLKLILFSLLACCIASDIGGYFFGKIFKGPKLTKISPNKTISGAIGSLFFSCLVLIILFYFFSINIDIKIAILAIITSLACQGGDLFFSFLKRKAKIKDTGSLLPGHGGVLDRIDGILIGIPAGIIVINNL